MYSASYYIILVFKLLNQTKLYLFFALSTVSMSCSQPFLNWLASPDCYHWREQGKPGFITLKTPSRIGWIITQESVLANHNSRCKLKSLWLLHFGFCFKRKECRKKNRFSHDFFLSLGDTFYIHRKGCTGSKSVLYG